MELLGGEAIAAALSGLVYEKKQLGEFSLDLTVREVRRFIDHGSVDFGGSEIQAAPTEPLPPLKRSPTDKYGWWDLHRGFYQVVFNEKPASENDLFGLILPARRLTDAGAYHAPAFINGPEIPPVILVAGDSGVNIKENARISTLIIFADKD